MTPQCWRALRYTASRDSDSSTMAKGLAVLLAGAPAQDGVRKVYAHVDGASLLAVSVGVLAAIAASAVECPGTMRRV